MWDQILMLEEKACLAVSAVCDDTLITKVFYWVDDLLFHVFMVCALVHSHVGTGRGHLQSVSTKH